MVVPSSSNSYRSSSKPLIDDSDDDIAHADTFGLVALFADAPPSQCQPHTSMNQHTFGEIDVLSSDTALLQPQQDKKDICQRPQDAARWEDQTSDTSSTDVPPVLAPTAGKNLSILSGRPGRLIDLSSLVPQTVAAPYRQCHYLPASKRCTKTIGYCGPAKETLQAILVRVEITQDEWEQGIKESVNFKHDVYKTSIPREEINSVTLNLSPGKVNGPLRFLFRHMGNRTVRDSLLLRGVEVVIAVEDVILQFECASMA